jgi:hypothetical protein
MAALKFRDGTRSKTSITLACKQSTSIPHVLDAPDPSTLFFSFSSSSPVLTALANLEAKHMIEG